MSFSLSHIEFLGIDSYNWRKNRIFVLIKELFEKHEEYSVKKKLAISYPLPILMQVLLNGLILKDS